MQPSEGFETLEEEFLFLSKQETESYEEECPFCKYQKGESCFCDNGKISVKRLADKNMNKRFHELIDIIF